jgi:HlyD family secretion protein
LIRENAIAPFNLPTFRRSDRFSNQTLNQQALAPDVTIPKNDGTSTAAPYYEVTIQPERPLLVKSALQYPIQPGMDVRADIISREETVLTFILRKARLITDL